MIDDNPDDKGRLDIKQLNYEFICLEAVRETMRLARSDWRNNTENYNKLIDSLNFLDALISITGDKEYEVDKSKCLDDPKEYFKVIVSQMKKSKIVSRKYTDII